MTHIVLLSGGSGTRLWPLSNSSRSKQFLKVLRDADGNHVSMVQRTFGQIAEVPLEKDVTIATSESQRDAIEAQVPEGPTLVFEPERRDTAPAIMLACESLSLEQGADPADTVVVMPIDTYADQAYFDSITALDAAVQSGASDLVLLGVKPTYPSEKYGYVVPASTEGAAPWPVARFTEKPDAPTAEGLISRGALWNCGVFAFRLGWLLDLTRRYLDEPTFEAYRENYGRLPRNSFDYEVVEGAESVSVVPYSGTWKDLGTWNTLTEEMAEPYSGDVHVDEGTVESVSAINETRLPMVVAGVSGAVVVATPDGILVSGKEASAHIKGIVAEAERESPMQETLSWGSYEVLDGTVGDRNAGGVREVVVRAGGTARLKGSACGRRIVVTSGTGAAAVAGDRMTLSPGSVLAVPAAEGCSISAETTMSLVEVTVGEGA